MPLNLCYHWYFFNSINQIKLVQIAVFLIAAKCLRTQFKTGSRHNDGAFISASVRCYNKQKTNIPLKMVGYKKWTENK